MIDGYTLGIIFLFSSFVYFIISASLWRLLSYEKSLSYFTLNSLLWIIGIILIFLRGKIPDFCSIVLANAIIVLGFSYLYLGVRKILKLGDGVHLEWTAFVLIFIHYYIFSAIMDSVEIRFIMFSIIVGIYLFFTGLLFLNHSDLKLKYVYKIGAGVFFIGVIIYIIRIVTVFDIEISRDGMHSSSMFYSLPFMYSILLNAWLSTTLGLIVSSKLQEELKDSYKNRIYSMSEIINNIAHQWRQPLNRINSNLAVIKSNIEEENIDKKLLEEKMKNIKKNTKYMSDTIEDFLHVFHTQKTKELFSLDDTLKSSVNMVEADNIKIIFIFEYYGTIYSYENEFIQVFMIILNNAINNFKTREIDNPEIIIKLHSDSKNIYISICDNGKGIDSETIKHIFEPYFTTKFQSEGTGLGLYIAKILIECSLNGTLDVKNSNDGVCFEIIISKEHENVQ